MSVRIHYLLIDLLVEKLEGKNPSSDEEEDDDEESEGSESESE